MTYAMVALTALGLGWVSGRVYERASGAWAEHRFTKAKLPVLLEIARALTLRAAGWVLITVLVAGFAMYLLTTG